MIIQDFIQSFEIIKALHADNLKQQIILVPQLMKRVNLYAYQHNDDPSQTKKLYTLLNDMETYLFKVKIHVNLRSPLAESAVDFLDQINRSHKLKQEMEQYCLRHKTEKLSLKKMGLLIAKIEKYTGFYLANLDSMNLDSEQWGKAIARNKVLNHFSARYKRAMNLVFNKNYAYCRHMESNRELVSYMRTYCGNNQQDPLTQYLIGRYIQRLSPYTGSLSSRKVYSSKRIKDSQCQRDYEQLELVATASAEDIRKAYLRLSRRFHPDKDPAAKDHFQEINAAYRRLLRMDVDIDSLTQMTTQVEELHNTSLESYRKAMAEVEAHAQKQQVMLQQDKEEKRVMLQHLAMSQKQLLSEQEGKVGRVIANAFMRALSVQLQAIQSAPNSLSDLGLFTENDEKYQPSSSAVLK